MESVTVCFIAFFVILAVLMTAWHFSRAREILTRWAEENGYEIVSLERCWFWKGPFFFWSSKSQEVHYVTVRTQDGQLRRGWVRCGGWFWGFSPIRRTCGGTNSPGQANG